MKDERWLELSRKVQEKQSPATSWKSDQKSLQRIIEYADRKEIDPTDALRADMCKLRTIIKEAKYAIAQEDDRRLVVLFHLAACLTIVKLRLELGTTHPDVISVRKVFVDQTEKYNISLLPEDFDRLQRTMKLFFTFVETNPTGINL